MNQIEIWYQYNSHETQIVYNGIEQIMFDEIKGIPIEKWAFGYSKGRFVWNGIWKELANCISINELHVLFYGREKDYKALANSLKNKVGQEIVMINAVQSETVRHKGVFELTAEELLHEARSCQGSDLEKSVLLLKKAYEKGSYDAAFNLGQIYLHEAYAGFDPEQAVVYFKSAAKANHSKAQRELGALLFDGRYVRKDQEEAVRLFCCAAEHGDSKAQYNLALCLLKGEGIERNLEDAMRWLTKAALKDDPEAQYLLAECYCDRNAVKEALRWYYKAHENGIQAADDKINEQLRRVRGCRIKNLPEMSTRN